MENAKLVKFQSTLPLENVACTCTYDRAHDVNFDTLRAIKTKKDADRAFYTLDEKHETDCEMAQATVQAAAKISVYFQSKQWWLY